MVDRLQVFEDKLNDVAERVGKLEGRMDTAETGRAEMLAKLANIEKFVGGYNTILGLAKKHWKTILVFGAGVMSSAGIGNPAVTDYIGKFFGG